MAEVWSTIGAFALGGVGWLATSFIGSPFRQFYDLRSEVIEKSILYANIRALAKQERPDYVSHIELDGADLDRLREAQEQFRTLAARMRAFALNEPFAVWLVKWRGYDPLKAPVPRFLACPIQSTHTVQIAPRQQKPLSRCCVSGPLNSACDKYLARAKG